MVFKLNRRTETQISADLRIIREYIRGSDLSVLTLRGCAQALGVSSNTIINRLTRGGTSWRACKDSERRWRLDGLMGRPGRRIPIGVMVTECGFMELGSFYRYFKAAKGESFSEWKAARPVLANQSGG